MFSTYYISLPTLLKDTANVFHATIDYWGFFIVNTLFGIKTLTKRIVLMPVESFF